MKWNKKNKKSKRKQSRQQQYHSRIVDTQTETTDDGNDNTYNDYYSYNNDETDIEANDNRNNTFSTSSYNYSQSSSSRSYRSSSYSASTANDVSLSSSEETPSYYDPPPHSSRNQHNSRNYRSSSSSNNKKQRSTSRNKKQTIRNEKKNMIKKKRSNQKRGNTSNIDNRLLDDNVEDDDDVLSSRSSKRLQELDKKIEDSRQQWIKFWRIVGIVASIIAVLLTVALVYLLTRPIQFEKPIYWFNCSYVINKIGLDYDFIRQTSPCNDNDGDDDSTLCTYSNYTVYMYCPTLPSDDNDDVDSGYGHYYTYNPQYGNSYGNWEQYDDKHMNGILPAIWEDSENCYDLYGISNTRDIWISKCQQLGYSMKYNQDNGGGRDDGGGGDENYYYENYENNNNYVGKGSPTCIRNQYSGIISCNGTNEDIKLDKDGEFYVI